MTHAASRYLSWQVLVVVSLVGVSSAATAQTVVPAYAGSYSLQVVGSIPGLPAPYGGLRFLDPNTILIGGAANTPSGRLYTIDVTRDAGGHITGFVGTAATTRYNQNELGQTKPGSLDEETFGVPFNFFFLSAGISSFTEGTLPAGGSVGGDFRLRPVGYTIVDATGAAITGATLDSDLLNPVPEPTSVVPLAGAVVVCLQRARRRTSVTIR